MHYFHNLRHSFALVSFALLIPIAVAGQFCYSQTAHGAISHDAGTTSTAVDPCCDKIADPADCLASAYYATNPALLTGNSLNTVWIDQPAAHLSRIYATRATTPVFKAQSGPPLRQSILYCRYLI